MHHYFALFLLALIGRRKRKCAGSLGWRFLMLKYKYQIGLRKQFYQTALVLWLEIRKILIAVLKNEFIVSFIRLIIFGTLSFPIQNTEPYAIINQVGKRSAISQTDAKIICVSWDPVNCRTVVQKLHSKFLQGRFVWCKPFEKALNRRSLKSKSSRMASFV